MFAFITGRMSNLKTEITASDFDKTLQLQAPSYIEKDKPLTVRVKKHVSATKRDVAGHPLFSSEDLGMPSGFASAHPHVALAASRQHKTYIVAEYSGHQGGKPGYQTFSKKGEAVDDNRHDFVHAPFNDLAGEKIMLTFRNMWRNDTRATDDTVRNGFTIAMPAHQMTLEKVVEQGSYRHGKPLSVIYASASREKAGIYDGKPYNFPSYGYSFIEAVRKKDGKNADLSSYSPDNYSIPYGIPPEAIKFIPTANSTGKVLSRNPAYIPPKLRDMELKEQYQNGDEIWGNEAETYLVRKGKGDEGLPNTHMHMDVLDGEAVRVFDWSGLE